jgi:hypothetical protein
MFVYATPPEGPPDLEKMEQKLRASFETRIEQIAADRPFVPLAETMLDLMTAAGRTGHTWGWNEWAGLYVRFELGKKEGFDAAFEYYEAAKAATRSIAALSAPNLLLADEPSANDDADMRRRSFTFKVGGARFTLMIFAHYESEVCKRVVVGTQPKYEMQCEGSALTAPVTIDDYPF